VYIRDVMYDSVMTSLKFFLGYLMSWMLRFVGVICSKAHK